MKRRLILGLLIALIATAPVKAYASTSLPGSGNDKPSTDTTDTSDSSGDSSGGGDGGGGGGGGGGDNGNSEPETPKGPELLTYTPNVTALHSLNAILAMDGTAIYFLPSKDDFPTDLKTTCADLTSEDGAKHRFAIVYDGYFDNEVLYSQVQNANSDTDKVTRLQTSKKVYSMSDNSRCLNLLGYDLLLSNEETVVHATGNDYTVDYIPTLVGNTPLTTKTIVMDLYKAVGAVEWDIKVFYGKDDELAVNTSPIQEQLKVLTNDETPGGIVTSEGATYVWATRTNPDIYWERCQRDVLFDGGAHNYTRENYVGNEVSVSFSKSEVDTMSFGEFCQLAKAVMELYGEPVLTKNEINAMVQAYALEIPTVGLNKEEIEALRYLAAKGIIDPSEINLTKAVTFADIEPIILRIADKDSRINISIPTDMSSYLKREGYVSAKISEPAVNVTGITPVQNPYEVNYYDYLVQAVDGKTNFYLTKMSGSTDMRHQEVDAYNGGRENSFITDTASNNSSLLLYNALPATIGTSDMPDEPLYLQEAFACNKLCLEYGSGQRAMSGTGLFEYLGLVEWDGDSYYHFRIGRDLENLKITYDYDTELEDLGDVKSYTLPEGDNGVNGGIFKFDGKGRQYYTFADADFSLEYIDSTIIEEDPLGFSDMDTTLSDTFFYYVTLSEQSLQGIGETEPFFKEDGNELSKQQLYDAISIGSWGDTLACGTSTLHPMHDPDDPDVIYLIVKTSMNQNELLGAFVTGATDTGIAGDAFYHDGTGKLFVSLDYLQKEKKLIRDVSWDANAKRLQFTADKLSVSIVVYNATDGGNSLALVGNTLIRTQGDAVIDDGGKLYIDYNIAMGWYSEVAIYKVDGTVIPIQDNVTSYRYETRSISSQYPGSSISSAYLIGPIQQGFSMFGVNPYASYIITHDENNPNEDHLFVYRLNKYVTSDGEEVSVPSSDNAYALLSTYAGLSLGDSQDYSLCHYILDRNSTDPSFNHGFLHISVDTYSVKNGAENHDFGWIYVPPEYNSVPDALDAWARGDDTQVLPIAAYSNGSSRSYVNLNYNNCYVTGTTKPITIGVQPYVFQTSAKARNLSSANLLCKMTDAGTAIKGTQEITDVTAIEISPAPGAVFQSAFGYESTSLANYKVNYSRHDVFYGNSRLKLGTSGQLCISRRALALEDDTKLFSVYKSGSSSIWVLNDKALVSEILPTEKPGAEWYYTEPLELVDWEQFKFGHLVENIDRLSSVVLIFILNIFPRVAMLIFFLLILFAMGKDIRIVHLFCEKYFDIFKFLSHGAQDVNTIDGKRVLFQSWICLVFFAVIMDGALINFIIFICRFLIVLWQH